MTSKRKARRNPGTRGMMGRRREHALFPAAPSRASLPRGYAEVLDEIKRRVQQERLRTVMAANSAIGRLCKSRLHESPGTTTSPCWRN